MVALDHELGWLLEQDVFSVDGMRYSWGDVLLSAELRGAFAKLASATRQGLACARPGAEGNALPPEAFREAASRFRYRQNLLSAEELEAWLARWRLSVADWTEHLRRILLSERRAGELERTEAAFPVAEEELAKAVAVDAVCTGFLEREARQLASDAALAEFDAGETDDRRALIERIGASAANARAALAAAAEVEREIGARALDWTRIDAELLELADLEAAREAALCVRVDGRSLTDVAADCGVPLERRAFYLEEAVQEQLSVLLGAGVGELVGPIARGEGFLLVHVAGRMRPSTEDPELRRRAEEYLVARAGERALEVRVRWA